MAQRFKRVGVLFPMNGGATDSLSDEMLNAAGDTYLIVG